MTDQEVTIGEIYRAVTRLEIAVGKTQDALAPLAALHERVKSTEDRLERVEPKLDSVAVNAGFIAGGVAVAGFLIQLLWK